MIKIKNIINVLCALCMSIPLFSQGGSNYSVFGLGDVIYGNGAAYQAMGGAQIAVPLTSNINLLNPAMLAFTNTTRLQTGYRFIQNIIQSEGYELWQNNGSLNGFASVFNFDTAAKISAALCMQPVSTVNYYIAVPVEIKEGEQVIANGHNRYQGLGGLSSLSIGLGAKTLDWLYLGGTFSSIFGKVDHNSYFFFNSKEERKYELRRSNSFEAYSYKLGLYVNPVQELGIGVFYEYIQNANVDHRDEYVYPYSIDSMISNTVIKSFEKVNMPNYFGAGFSYVIGKFMFAGDYLLGTFSDFSINSASNVAFRNSQKYSFGINRMGNPNPFASLADKASYKVGAYYEQLYYSINGNDVNEMAVTCGLQYPLSRFSQIDFSIAMGKRSTAAQGFISEWFGRMVIDISIGDTWFKPVRRY